ncbi:MAG: hypothetical protein KatS3mg055_2801 [Chloroflexus sp.]|nr:MAG: hypothetical protein KatS3mg055_2801 [Chloroflexus sp.]
MRQLERRKQVTGAFQKGQRLSATSALHQRNAIVAQISAFAVSIIDSTAQRQRLFEEAPRLRWIIINAQATQRCQHIGFAQPVANRPVERQRLPITRQRRLHLTPELLHVPIACSTLASPSFAPIAR